MLRAVLDANIYASALIQPKGASGRILRLSAKARTFQLIVTEAILEEIGDCLFYPRVRKRVPLSDDEIRQWLAAIALLAEVVSDPGTVDRVSADPDDNKILAAAVEGAANYVVTGDNHLLDLVEHEGIRILTPVAFVQLIEPSS